jgi:hypothetical protein
MGPSGGISMSGMKRFQSLCHKNVNSGLTITSKTIGIKALEFVAKFPKIPS